MIRFDTKKDLEYYDNLHREIHKKDKEIERLNNIKKEAIETLDKEISYCEIDGENYNVCKMALNIMKEARDILKGEDK